MKTPILLIALAVANIGHAAPTSVPSSYLLPLNCNELLPDPSLFVGFFEAVGRGLAGQDNTFSKRIFKVLAIRNRLAESPDAVRDQNPVDGLVRKLFCFYREQREPIKPVPYDDPSLIKFLREGMKDLEDGTDKAVFDWEFERQQRREFERKVQKNQAIVDSLRADADREAARTISRISTKATKKAKQ